MLTSLNQLASINPFPNPDLQSKSKIEDTKPNSSSSTDSTHDSNPKSQKYIFQNNQKFYEVYLILYEEKIKIKVNLLSEGKDEYFYEKDITNEEFKKINRVFKLCSDIDDLFEYLNELFSDKENQIMVKENFDNNNNHVFILEKKVNHFPLKIEIPKKYIKNEIQNNLIIYENPIIKNELLKDIKESKEKNNNLKNIDNNIINNKNENNKDKDIEDITQLNITDEKLLTEKKINKLHNFLYNNKEEMNILELPEEEEEQEKNKKIYDQEKDKDKESSKKSLINVSKNKINDEKRNSNNSLLNRKRTNNSDISDASFTSQSNENDYSNNNLNNINNSKRQKNKENLMRIISDNGSVGSGESNVTFFEKIKKNISLEKNKTKNLNDLDKKNSENKKEENERSYLYGEEDSTEFIKDDLDLFSNKSNKSPTINPINTIGVKNNKINDLPINMSKYPLLIKDNSQDYSQKYIYDNLMSKNYKNCIQAVQNIQIKDGGKESIINQLNNNFQPNIGYNYYKKSKFNKPDKSYRIIHKNYIEYSTTEISYLFGEEMNNLNSKTFSVESNIISGYSEFDFIIKYLKQKFNKEIKDAIHIYQATQDGPTAKDFHRVCDGNTNIVVLIKTKDGKKFGGYTSVGFSNFNRSYIDDTAFIFSIDKREIYPNIKGKSAIDSFYNLGPCFSGESIKIFDNFIQNGGITVKNSANYETNEDYQINCGQRSFGVEEIEVLEFLEKKNDDDNNI